MPRAEVGSTKYLNNKLKSKGLQRLRWYCQVCERQMRDENGFKMHVQSESHVRQMVVVGENSGKFIQDYSNQFRRDFLQLLKTSHGEKKVNANHFYQEYIANKEHVHMNATRWSTLSEFTKMLGREGICRVDEGERGLEIAWIDDSPEALRRQDAIRKKERQDKGDEEREQRSIQEQVERARREAKDGHDAASDEAAKELKRDEGGKIKLNFGSKASATTNAPPAETQSPEHSSEPEATRGSPRDTVDRPRDGPNNPDTVGEISGQNERTLPQTQGGMSVPSSTKQVKNVFARVKTNPLSLKTTPKVVQSRPMSEAERIMKDELERKARREQHGPPRKKSRFE